MNWPRVFAAFILAPLIPSALYATYTLFDGLQNGTYFHTLRLVVGIGGYPPAIVLGVPAFLILRNFFRPAILNVALTGGLVAALPWLLLTIFHGDNMSAVSGKHVTMDNGHTTFWGWLEDLKTIGEIFLWGIFGGIVFWFVAIWKPKAKNITRPIEGVVS